MNELVGKLCRAELITHMVEIDPELVSEQDAAACVLDVLNAQVFRIGPFQYGVDLSKFDADSDEMRVDAVTDALSARLGPEAVGLKTLVLDQSGPAEDASPQDEDSLLLMRAVAAAAENALSEGDQTSRAMLSAEFAVRAAELTAKGLSKLALPPSDGIGDLAPKLQATTDALGSLEGRLDHLERRIGEITETTQSTMQDWAEGALLHPLRLVEERIGALRTAQTETLDDWATGIGERLEAVEQGQIPAEWFLGQIMARIGDLDAQLTDSDVQVKEAAIEWARRLDDRISSVADQLIPPEWFLGRIMTRIGELDEQLSGTEQQSRAVAQDWAERFDARLSSVAEQIVPPEWFLGKVLTRIDELEERTATARASEDGAATAPQEALNSVEAIHDMLAQIRGKLDQLENRPSAEASEPTLETIQKGQAEIRKSLSSLKGQVTAVGKSQTQWRSEIEGSLDLMRRALAELLARPS